VSIIIPVYNGSNYLSDAIDSALSQTYSNVEIIVVNDGSTDDTEKICLRYGNRIRYISKENGGVATALNLGIRNMRGEYFSWLSHDDIYYTSKIETQVDILQANRNKDVVIGNIDFLDMATETKRTYDLQTQCDPCDPSKITQGVYPSLFGVVHACVMLVSKSRIDEVGLLDENLRTTQDIEWIFRLLRGRESVYIREPLIAVRLHAMQGKHQIKVYSEEQSKTHIALLEMVTPDEIAELFENSYMFYYQMAMFYKRDNDRVAFQYAKTKFEQMERPPMTNSRVSELRYQLSSFSNGAATKLCLFGAGNIGQRMQQDLLARGIAVDCFSDNNAKLWGNSISGASVVRPIDIDKASTLVIVAVEKYDDLLNDLLSLGYLHTVSYRDVIPHIGTAYPVCIPG